LTVGVLGEGSWVGTLTTVPRGGDANGVRDGVDSGRESLVVNLHKIILLPLVWEVGPTFVGGASSSDGAELPWTEWASFVVVGSPASWHGVAMVTAVDDICVGTGSALGLSNFLVGSADGLEDTEHVQVGQTVVSPSVEVNCWVGGDVGSRVELEWGARTWDGDTVDEATGVGTSPGGEVGDLSPTGGDTFTISGTRGDHWVA